MGLCLYIYPGDTDGPQRAEHGWNFVSATTPDIYRDYIDSIFANAGRLAKAASNVDKKTTKK